MCIAGGILYISQDVTCHINEKVRIFSSSVWMPFFLELTQSAESLRGIGPPNTLFEDREWFEYVLIMSNIHIDIWKLFFPIQTNVLMFLP